MQGGMLQCFKMLAPALGLVIIVFFAHQPLLVMANAYRAVLLMAPDEQSYGVW